jgi:hypothetical protein
MEKDKKKIVDLGILETDEISGVKKISLVEEPAIMLDFHYFNTQKVEKFVNPSSGESEEEFISRCIPYVINEGKDEAQAAAICYSYWDEKMAGVKVSFDYHDTLNTERGKELAKKAITEGEIVYVISAGQNKDEFMPIVKELGIDPSKVFATGSNEAKIEKIKELGIQKHYDNNQDVIDAIGEIGMKFDINVTGLPAYVDQIPKKKKDIVTRAILAQSECDNSWTKDQYVVDTIVAVAKEIGTKEEDLGKLFDMQFAQAITPGTNPAEASQTKDRELILYKYMGDIGADSRSFCRQMVSADLYYTKQQIQSFDSLIANPGFGHNGASYSLFKYKGGPNCKHRWNDFLVKSTKDGKIYIQDLGPAAGTAGIKPKDMAKNGYYNTINESIFSFAAEEQQILVGPCMIPSMKILRVDEDGQKYFVKFSPETIKEIALKYFKEGRVHELNTDHEENTAGAYIFESWLVETVDDKANTLYGYNVPIGSWMISVKVEDAETWARVKAGELRGFSIEGILVDLEELESFKTYERIKKILGTNDI